MKFLKRFLLAVLCAVFLAQSAMAETPAQSARELAVSAAEGQKNLVGVSGSLLAMGEVFPAGTSLCDWTAMGFSLLGIEDDTQTYLQNLNAYISEHFLRSSEGREPKATDWQRAALTVRALGGDPTACGKNGEVDLIAGGTYNYSGDSLGKQGLNGWIFALIALDSDDYEIPDKVQFSREDMLSAILSAQEEDGGFGLVEGSSDTDITAMALQALAPYKSDVASDAVNRAVEYLANQVTEDALFAYWGQPTAESSAQVVIALCALGIDPEEDARFTKDGINILDAMTETYRRSDGSYAHLQSDAEGDAMATEQVMLALTALWKLRDSGTRIYDFRGLPVSPVKQSTGSLPYIACGVIVCVGGVVVVVLRKKKEKQA